MKRRDFLRLFGGTALIPTVVAAKENVSNVPKLRIFDSGIISVTVGDELVYGDWECSFTSDFREFDRAPKMWSSRQGRPWILNYVRDARHLATYFYGRANPQRYLRVSVNGIYAEDIIDLTKFPKTHWRLGGQRRGKNVSDEEFTILKSRYRVSKNCLCIEGMNRPVCLVFKVFSDIPIFTFIEEAETQDFINPERTPMPNNTMAHTITGKYMRLAFYSKEPSEGHIDAFWQEDHESPLIFDIMQILESRSI